MIRASDIHRELQLTEAYFAEKNVSHTFGYNLTKPLPKENQTRVVIKDKRSERPLQILQADEFYDQVKLSKSIPIQRAVAQYNSSQDSNLADVEIKRGRNDPWKPVKESREIHEASKKPLQESQKIVPSKKLAGYGQTLMVKESTAPQENLTDDSEADAIDAAIDDLQKEIDHKLWYMDKKKKDMSGPYGRVYSSQYRKNMRADFATYKELIKAWKAEIAELKKKKKGLKSESNETVSKGKWAQLAESHFKSLSEGGPGSGGQYPTQKLKMPMSPFVSVGTRKGILKNMPYDTQDVPLSKITHVAQSKFVPFKVKRLCKDVDAITKKPVCLLYVPSEDAYHVMDGHHRFLAAQKKGIETLPARVWSRYEEPKDDLPAPEAEPAPEANPDVLNAMPVEQAVELPAEAEPLPDETAEAKPEGLPNPVQQVDKPEEPPKPAEPEKPAGLPDPVHEHFQMVCEKCDIVTESCGCVNEEKVTKKTVCESCRENSFAMPSLEAALESIQRYGLNLQKLKGA